MFKNWVILLFKFLNAVTPCFFTPLCFTVGAANTPQRANKTPYLEGTGAPRHYQHTFILWLVQLLRLSVMCVFGLLSFQLNFELPDQNFESFKNSKVDDAFVWARASMMRRSSHHGGEHHKEGGWWSQPREGLLFKDNYAKKIHPYHRRREHPEETDSGLYES